LEQTSARERIPHPNLGAHDLYFEPPFILRIVLHGDLVAGEMTAIVDASARVGARSEHGIVALIDIGDQGIISTEARKIAANQANVYRALTLFGGNRIQRALGNLMLRVIGLVQKNAVPTQIFKDEREAHTWIEASLAEEKI
jgi:hypothetical protein